MKIQRIYIKNYKSIKELDINLSDRLNVFIGENSVGKSNIFSAIDWVLGAFYPSFNNVSSEDFYGGNKALNLIIRLYFNDGNFLELNNKWRDSYGHEKSGLNLNGNGYISDDVRQKYMSAFIGTERKLSDNPASNRWSILGRLLKDVNEKFILDNIVNEETGEIITKKDLFKAKMQEIKNNLLFSVKDSDGNNIMEKFIEILAVETAKQLNRSSDEFKIDLNMYDPWNYYRTMQILVSENETGIIFKASDLGMGIQASITIAILKAYSKIKLNNQTPIFIDEPELFLHPQGRRNFYQIIRDLVDNGTQVFLTTHSSEFIDLDYFNEIYVVRKNRDKGTYVRHAKPLKFVEDFLVRHNRTTTETEIMQIYKNAFENTGDSQKSSEAFFARKVILVEGESETLILPYFFKLKNYNYIAEGVTIVRCGGKSEIDRFYRLYSEFGIPCFVIFDGDKQNHGSSDEEATIKKNKNILTLFDNCGDYPDNIVYDKYLGFEKRLEENLGLGDVGSLKALKLYKRVKENIITEEQVPAWIGEVIEKLNNLPHESSSVLKSVDTQTS